MHNVQNIKTFILSKLLNRFQPNFASRPQVVIVDGPNKSKMVDGRHFGRPLNRYISTTIWPILITSGMVTHIAPYSGSLLFFSHPRSKGCQHLHLSLSSVILTAHSSTGSPVHILMLSIQAVHDLPRLRAPGIVPCIISFSMQFPCFLMVWS